MLNRMPWRLSRMNSIWFRPRSDGVHYDKSTIGAATPTAKELRACWAAATAGQSNLASMCESISAVGLRVLKVAPPRRTHLSSTGPARPRARRASTVILRSKGDMHSRPPSRFDLGERRRAARGLHAPLAFSLNGRTSLLGVEAMARPLTWRVLL